MNDFIVDEEDELDEQGNVIRRKEKKKRQSNIKGISGYALSEAQEIFGDTTDLLEMYQERKKQREQAEAEVTENTEGLNEVRPMLRPIQSNTGLICTLGGAHDQTAMSLSRRIQETGFAVTPLMFCSLLL